jgi:hypothetical protein
MTRRPGSVPPHAVLFAAVLTLAIIGLGAPLLAHYRRSKAADETLARQAIATKLSEIQSHPFRRIFALYNNLPHDDPSRPFSAPGPRFDVPGAGRIGRIEFPVDGVDQLREDTRHEWAGLPRDLNGDRRVDGSDHASDYRILPLRLVVEWEAKGALHRVEQIVFLSDQ